MSLKSTAKRIAMSVVVDGVLEVLRGSLIELLKDATPESLYYAIKQDKDTWVDADNLLKGRGRRWARKLRDHQDKIDHKLILEWLREDRPDLWSIIVNMDREGTSWLKRRVDEWKLKLWPLEEETRGNLILKETEVKPETPEPEPVEETKTEVRYGLHHEEPDRHEEEKNGKRIRYM